MCVCVCGGGGVHARRPEMDNVFFLLFLFLYCPQLILQFIEGVQWFDYRENYTSKEPEGV